LLTILGLLIAMVGGTTSAAEGGSGAALAIGVLMFLAGLVWFVVTRIRVWWRHG
jgi:hypothetical protein